MSAPQNVQPAGWPAAHTSWHTLTVKETAKLLETDPGHGLDVPESERRLHAYGPNELEAKRQTTPLTIFLSQFNDFMIWVLLVAALISGVLLREAVDALAITVIVILNAILGFRQEFRAEKALEQLRKLAAPTAKVVRSGEEQEVAGFDLVPGDLILLEAGDHVPADARLAHATAFRVDEAALTGESGGVAKSGERLETENLSLGDRTNLVYMGTMVQTGRAKALVFGTGMATEIGKISALIAAPEEKTPLQAELRSVGRAIAVLALSISGIVFAFGFGVRGYDPAEIFLLAVALAVAAIPEGLPAVVTVSLALGVQAMAAKNAIVRKLHAVETLGSTTIICSDKTGTLTENRMTLARLYVDGQELNLLDEPAPQRDGPLDLLLRAAVLCNDARYGKGGVLIGDPTETALVEAAARFSMDVAALRDEHPRVAEIPFDSARKQMTTISANGRVVAYVKGAAERLLSQAATIETSTGRRALTDAEREELRNVNDRLAKDGFRVMAFALRPLPAVPAEADLPAVEHDLVFLGLGGLLDPPRPQVAGAIATCRTANIKVSMVTGDHKLTAQTIARQIGLLEGDRTRVIAGDELQRLSEEELADIADEVAVYARVAPEDKVKIVNALRRRGHIVAMTGDGVNDAPAVKRADIGIAMGIVGTDVTKEAADMVLSDDNFATIVRAVREGRLIFDNLRKFILFLLSCNVSEVLTLFLAVVVPTLPLPLLPIHLLWINLVTDGLPALALGVDPPAPNLMERPPRPRGQGILAGPRWRAIAWWGALLTLGVMTVFLVKLFLLGGDGSGLRTMVFSTMVLGQLFHTFNFRAGTASVFSRVSLRNRYLLGAIGGSLALQLSVIYVPLLQPVFRTRALALGEWGLVLVGALMPLVLLDAYKRLVPQPIEP